MVDLAQSIKVASIRDESPRYVLRCVGKNEIM